MEPPHIAALAAWLAGWGLLSRVPRLPRLAPAVADDPVTVVIPARNEATSLPALLGDLEAARPAGARVVVVDDHSDDGTAEVAAGFSFVRVERAPPSPRDGRARPGPATSAHPPWREERSCSWTPTSGSTATGSDAPWPSTGGTVDW